MRTIFRCASNSSSQTNYTCQVPAVDQMSFHISVESLPQRRRYKQADLPSLRPYVLAISQAWRLACAKTERKAVKTCSTSHTSAICCGTHIVHLGCLTNLSSTGEHLTCTPDSHDGKHVARDGRMHLMHILINGGNGDKEVQLCGGCHCDIRDLILTE